MPLDSSDVALLQDVLTFAKKVNAMVDGLTQEAFLADTKTFFAVCYGIQVVGEAVWKVSDDLKKAHAVIPWSLIAGMRHRLVHDYGRTDENVIYQVATVHVPRLIEQVHQLLAEHGHQV